MEFIFAKVASVGLLITRSATTEAKVKQNFNHGNFAKHFLENG
jgi:hypothetical protein